jgi:hypothetical protein
LSRAEVTSEALGNSLQTASRIGWVPLLILVACALTGRDRLPAWVFMWALAFSIYAGLKWLTWWRARNRVTHPAWRSAAYLLAWPGMDPESFLDSTRGVPKPTWQSWASALFETTMGGALLWLVARTVPDTNLLLRGWIGMLGLILLLHFGTFQIIALLWQQFGVDAKPIMSAPLRSMSLGEFWGKRWNLGFRQLSHDLIFHPLHRSLGAGGAGFVVFVVSGLIHDFVISFPARGGYGLPTLYFLLQGMGVPVERSSVGRHLSLRQGVRGWLFMALITAAPAFWLFHPPFVRRVILPFMRAIHAL